MPKLASSLAERIKLYSQVDANGCWVWTRKIDRHGYGHVSVRGVDSLAHRAAYAELVGPIPEGLTIDHLCKQTKCVNPRHLEPVTVRENILRGNGIGVRNATKTHCSAGHPYDDRNTYLWHGSRYCRACRRMRLRKGRK